MRLSVSVSGTVQGVGFRPFVYRSACALRLTGWVRNARGQVEIEVQGPPHVLDNFLASLRADSPSQARVEDVRYRPIPEVDDSAFLIVDSSERDSVEAALPADLAPCEDCLAEAASIEEPRYRYPFTCCTRCGPRYSIVEALPYDRVRTSMREFDMCARCLSEYRNTNDRRFHAEPIACPECGPRLFALDTGAQELAEGDPAITCACSLLRNGSIVAVKGLGGFQLLVDATNPHAVERLRHRKRREERPFAVLFPTIAYARSACDIDDQAEALLTATAAPIVLVPRRAESNLAASVAPANPFVGAMLPPTLLHTLLARDFGGPLVCTSGNPSGEPMCIEFDEAREKLAGIADAYLTHDRRIVRPLDDSVIRPHTGMIRRARGYAPQVVARVDTDKAIIGVGGHLKNTVSLAVGGRIVTSQHLADLESPQAVALLNRTIEDLCRFYTVQPEFVACDAHPDYQSTRTGEALAARCGARLLRVQHHHAHVAAVMAEHALSGPVLGLAWDGTGHGDDGTIWGCEALVCDGAAAERIASLSPFPLLGGDRAAREPRRSALGLIAEACPDLFEEFAERLMPETPPKNVANALRLAPRCSSLGRVFDAMACLLGLFDFTSFEGQAAMAVEFQARTGAHTEADYDLPMQDSATLLRADFRPLVRGVLSDLGRGVKASEIAMRLHNSCVSLGVALAEKAGIEDVVLSGGCFQNAILVGKLASRLNRAGFRTWRPRELPANDGAISAGQVLVASFVATSGPASSGFGSTKPSRIPRHQS